MCGRFSRSMTREDYLAILAEETAALIAWQDYRLDLMRIDAPTPDWPTPPGEQAS